MDRTQDAEPHLNRLRLADGVELHYIAQGQGEPLVLLHGGMGDFRSWGPQMEAFARSYRVISYSRRYSYPNGNALNTRNHSAFVEAEDLAALLRELRLTSVHFVGTSYGAFVALTYAVESPQTVRSLVLAEPPVLQWVRGSLGGEAVYLEFITNVWMPAMQAFENGLVRHAMRLLFDGIRGRPMFDMLTPDLVTDIMRNARSMQALALSSDPFPDLPKTRVRQLDVPTLLVSSEHAIEIHQLVNAELARVLPHAEQAVIPDAGHGSPCENPVAFNEVVLRFLAGQRQRF